MSFEQSCQVPSCWVAVTHIMIETKYVVEIEFEQMHSNFLSRLRMVYDV